MWKVRADCTYTTSANKTARQTAVQTLIDSYPTAVVAEPGRFEGGLTSQSSTRFTVAYDFVDVGTAQAFHTALMSSVTASTRSVTLVSIHEG